MVHLFAAAEFKLLGIIKSERIAQEYERQLDINVYRLFDGDIEYREDLATGVRYFFPFASGDDSFYNKLQEFDWYYQDEKEEYYFASRFTEGRSVLDIGCGSGKFAAFAQAKSYTGLETNHAAAEDGRRRGLRITNMQLADYYEVNAARFEVVTLFQVLEHVPEPIQFLEHARECLRPGGLMIVSVPSEDSFVGKAKNAILNLPPHHMSRWTDCALHRVGGILSLDIIELRHECLDALHVDWYAQVQAREKLERLLMRKSPLFFGDGAVDSLIRRSSKLLAKLTSRSVAVRRRNLRGHTVTVIYRKID